MDEEAAVLLEVHSTTKDANESSDGMGEWEDERCGIASDDGVVGAPGSSSSKSVGVEAGLEWSGWGQSGRTFSAKLPKDTWSCWSCC